MQRIMQRIIEFLKQYWDILGGTLLGVIITVIFKWQIEKIKIAYSLIILILVFIGFLKVVFNDYEKNKKDKEGNEDVLHQIVDSQISMKAIKISQNPMQEGEKLGQGMFVPFFITNDDNTENERTGGFGSTGA